jgi:hypothetical protein
MSIQRAVVCSTLYTTSRRYMFLNVEVVEPIEVDAGICGATKDIS